MSDMTKRIRKFAQRELKVQVKYKDTNWSIRGQAILLKAGPALCLGSYSIMSLNPDLIESINRA